VSTAVLEAGGVVVAVESTRQINWFGKSDAFGLGPALLTATALPFLVTETDAVAGFMPGTFKDQYRLMVFSIMKGKYPAAGQATRDALAV